MLFVDEGASLMHSLEVTPFLSVNGKAHGVFTFGPATVRQAVLIREKTTNSITIVNDYLIIYVSNKAYLENNRGLNIGLINYLVDTQRNSHTQWRRDQCPDR